METEVTIALIQYVLHSLHVNQSILFYYFNPDNHGPHFKKLEKTKNLHNKLWLATSEDDAELVALSSAV